MTIDTLEEWRRGEVDGVPLFWCPAPRLSASLQFRTGHADETLRTSGINHLVEHLVLSRLEGRRYAFNGFVDGLRTVFHMTGSDEEAVDFLYAVTTGLGNLALERLDLECRVLLSEAAQRRPSSADAALWFRYGNRGFGLRAQAEHGLGWLDEASVTAWAGNWFNRHNAVLWLSGPPHSALRLALGDGAHRAPPSPTPLEDLAGRDVFGLDRGVVAEAGIVARTDASIAALQVAAARATRSLRHDSGLTYGVAVQYDRLAARSAHGLLAADSTPENAQYVLDGIVETLEGLAAEGPTDAEIERHQDAFRRGQDDPLSAMPILDAVALDQLLGVTPRARAEVVTAVSALNPDYVRGAARDLVDSSIVLAPPGLKPRDERYHPGIVWSRRRVEGRHFVPAVGRSPIFRELMVGPEGLTGISGDARAVTVSSRECVAMVQGPRTRTVHGLDGMAIHVDEQDWVSGDALIDLVDAAIPAEAVVPSTVIGRRPPGAQAVNGGSTHSPSGRAADGRTRADPRRPSGSILEQLRVRLPRRLMVQSIAFLLVAVAASAYAILISAGDLAPRPRPSPARAAAADQSARPSAASSERQTPTPTMDSPAAPSAATTVDSTDTVYANDAKGFSIRLSNRWIISETGGGVSPPPDFAAIEPGQGLTVVRMAGARAESLETLAAAELDGERHDPRVTRADVRYVHLPAGRTALITAKLKSSTDVSTGVLTSRRTYLFTSAGFLYQLVIWSRPPAEQSDAERQLFDGIPEGFEPDKPGLTWAYTDTNLGFILVAPGQWVLTKRDVETRELWFQPTESLTGRPAIPTVHIALIDTGYLPSDYAPKLESQLEAAGATILESGYTWAEAQESGYARDGPASWAIDYLGPGPKGAIRGHLLLDLAYPGLATVGIEWRVASGYVPEPALLKQMIQVAVSFEPLY